MNPRRIGHILILAGLGLFIVGLALLVSSSLLNIGEQGWSGGVGFCVVIFFIPVCAGYGDASLPMFLFLASILVLVIVLLPILLSHLRSREA